MCKIKDLHEALCFEAQMERYCHCQADEIGWFAWQFWMLRARIWRAACKALQKLGMTDMPF